MSVNNYLFRLDFEFYEKSRFCYRKMFEIISSADIFGNLKVKYYQVTFIQDISNQPPVLHLGFCHVAILFPSENKFLADHTTKSQKTFFENLNSRIQNLAFSNT